MSGVGTAPGMWRYAAFSAACFFAAAAAKTSAVLKVPSIALDRALSRADAATDAPALVDDMPLRSRLPHRQDRLFGMTGIRCTLL
ncbi:MAG: hypothetical protein MZV70_02295 [Desulfobacterales bacterium]|nr:hypothetical protein [Desulfobacterales bacterium]